MDEAPAALLRVRADDPEYVAQAQAEANYWSTARSISDASDAPGGDFAQWHHNRRFTNNEQLRWFESICTHGEFRSGLVLGAGGIIQEARILETNPSLHLTVLDISPGALALRDRQLVPRFPGRVTTHVADFNFIELPGDTYDLIISSSVMHHVTNLEHVAYQVRRALKPDGLFFLHDYVGESRRRFAPEKKLAFELLYNRELTRQGRPPSALDWSNGDDRSSPFCGVRSAEILGVFQTYLQEVDVRTAGALWYPVLFATDVRAPRLTTQPWRIIVLRGLRKMARLIGRRRGSRIRFFNPAYIQQLLDVSDRLTDAGELLPSNAFAIYRRRPPVAISVPSP